MPRYEWQCRECGLRSESFEQRFGGRCPGCGGPMRRRYSIMTPAPSQFFQPHFNWSLGRYVSSPKDFRDGLARKGDEMSERLGVEHRYVEHHHGDRVGLTDGDGDS